MINEIYRRQVQLLLQVLSQVARETMFALKGGTAINLFVEELPRLSVDIDLTYLPVVDRGTDLKAIAEGLVRIKNSLESLSPRIESTLVTQSDGIQAKLMCQQSGTQIKVEVNTTIRGHLWPIRTLPVRDKVQEEFGLFSANQVISQAELYGGKICAALDRQHPRDLFDVAMLYESEGITDEIKYGFIASLLSHGRPMHELLNPTFTDQRQLFVKQFDGMAYKPFSYEQFESTRKQLIGELQKILSDRDCQFLISFKRGSPDWNLFPWSNLQDLPAVQWKLQNINQLLKNNPKKHAAQLQSLEHCLGSL